MIKKKSVDMCNGPLAGKILIFTIPIILSSLLQLLFNAADMIVVGNFSGSDAVAAVGSTGSLYNLLINLFIGFSLGSGIAISHAVGANQREAIHKIAHTSVLTALISGILISVIGIFLSPLILQAMGSPKDVLDQSVLYLRIVFLGMPATMIYNFGASMLRSIGETKRPLFYLTISGAVNVILNLILVIIFHLGVAGVAIATAISQFVSATLIFIDLIRGNEYFKIDLKQVKIHKAPLFQIIKIGLPAGIQGSLFSLSNVLIQSAINSFNSVAIVAGNSAASNVEGFTYAIMNSFYQAALTFSAQNMGAKKYNRISRILIICVLFSGGFGFIACTIARLFGTQILSFYCPQDAEAIKIGLIRFDIVIKFHFLCGIMEVLSGVLRGMGYSLISMLVSLFGACVLRIIWIYTIFQKIHTLNCLLISYIVSWSSVIIISLIIYCFLIKALQKNKLNAQKSTT